MREDVFAVQFAIVLSLINIHPQIVIAQYVEEHQAQIAEYIHKHEPSHEPPHEPQPPQVHKDLSTAEPPKTKKKKYV